MLLRGRAALPCQLQINNNHNINTFWASRHATVQPRVEAPAGGKTIYIQGTDATHTCATVMKRVVIAGAVPATVLEDWFSQSGARGTWAHAATAAGVREMVVASVPDAVASPLLEALQSNGVHAAGLAPLGGLYRNLLGGVASHTDAPVAVSHAGPDVITRWTVLVYASSGGAPTVFDCDGFEVHPRTGTAVAFEHSCVHHVPPPAEDWDGERLVAVLRAF